MKHKYPDHFYEPIRIEIAISQFQHDVRKLFKSLNSQQFEKIDEDIKGWFQGEKYELEEAHDFWNLFDGFTRGLKLKSLLSWITAENVLWQSKNVPIKDIIITWDFPGLEFMGKAPYKAEDVIKELKKHATIFKELKQDLQERSERFLPRDQFPIILFDDPKGGVINSFHGYYVLEGNRRTVKAITEEKRTISAFVGKFRNPDVDLWPENYWINTGRLRDLIFLAIKADKTNDKKAFDVIRKFYQLLLRDFELARIATIDKTFKNFERDDRFLLDLILEDLK